jgi:hypothetical protein
MTAATARTVHQPARPDGFPNLGEMPVRLGSAAGEPR